MPFEHSDSAAVHAGSFVTPENRPSSPPLYQASSYEFEDLPAVEAIYGGTRAGRIYGRYGGPNASHFETAMAELEGAEAAVGASAGMAAIDAALATAHRGNGILAASLLYGGTSVLLEKDYQQRGVPVRFVDTSDLGAVAAELATWTPDVLYVEALTNPLMRVADLPALAALARSAGTLLIVDATFATPVLVRPLALGADLVVHSVGKYLGGHGDVGAGVVAGAGPLVERCRAYLIRRGATIPHFEAWLALRGMRTLGLRMRRHSDNAAAVAAYLAVHPAVTSVAHPSLGSHPDRALAARLYAHGTGGIVACELAGADAVAAFVERLDMIAIVHSLGEVATTVSVPVHSSHRTVAPESRRAQGIGPGTVRISCGIEDARDIIADLEQALAGLAQRPAATGRVLEERL